GKWSDADDELGSKRPGDDLINLLSSNGLFGKLVENIQINQFTKENLKLAKEAQEEEYQVAAEEETCNVYHDDIIDERKLSSYGFLATFLNCSVIVGFDECPRSEGMPRAVRHLLRILKYGDLLPAMLYGCACTLKLFIDKWYKTNHLKKSSRTKFLHTMHLAIDRFQQSNHLRQMCQKEMSVDHDSHKGINDQVDSQVAER
ncbi:unnamed protein product, partial [Didymodactylos carnosus]